MNKVTVFIERGDDGTYGAFIEQDMPYGEAFGLSIGDRLLYTLSREELILLSLSINDALYGLPIYLDEKGGEQ